MAEAVTHAQGSLCIQGGGTRGGVTEGTVLSTQGVSGIELYEPGALTIVARAGTTLAEVDSVLAAENQRLAFESADYRGLLGTDGASTLGGVVAANISGPRRIQAGACRDFLLGVRYVDGAGTVIKNGGRVMKNVTGYDLVKLLSGSWGTLGVMTEVGLKVLPRSDTQATVLVGGVGVPDAVGVMSAALGSPFEVSGAAYDPARADGPAVLLRIEGFEESVAYRVAQVSKLVGAMGPVSVVEDRDASDALWTAVRDVAPFHQTDGDVWRLSVKPSDAPEIAERMRADGLLFDWGGGVIWARVPDGTDLRSRLGGFRGHATVMRSSAETRKRLGKFQPEAPALAAISDGLRRKFDPRGLFNPDLMRSPAEV